jgi:hypothetical protein
MANLVWVPYGKIEGECYADTEAGRWFVSKTTFHLKPVFFLKLSGSLVKVFDTSDEAKRYAETQALNG